MSRTFLLLAMEIDAVDAAPKIRPFLTNDDEATRMAAAHALAMFGDHESEPRVVELLTREVEAAEHQDALWMLGLTCVAGLAPAFEKIVREPKVDPMRRWGAIRAIAILEQKRSATTLAKYIKTLEIADQVDPEQLGNAIGALARCDGETYRRTFERYRDADELEVRLAALGALVQLGDKKAAEAYYKLRPDAKPTADEKLDPDLQRKLSTTRLRLSQVKGCTLQEVCRAASEALGIPVEITKSADERLRRGRFGWYVDFLGYRPRVSEVLGNVQRFMFSGGTLLPDVRKDRIVLLRPEELQKGRKKK